jgi:mRNA interferase MazF
LFWVDFAEPRGSEQAGNRPAVVISNNVNNQHAPTVVVAAITKTIPKRRYPQNVHVPAGELKFDSTILGNQVLTVDKTRLGNQAGRLTDAQVGELNRALRVAFGL